MRSPPNVWRLVGITYGLVIATVLMAIGGYYYYLSQRDPADQSEPDPTRRIREADCPLKPVCVAVADL